MKSWGLACPGKKGVNLAKKGVKIEFSIFYSKTNNEIINHENKLE
jgi:hypothetical protein